MTLLALRILKGFSSTTYLRGVTVPYTGRFYFFLPTCEVRIHNKPSGQWRGMPEIEPQINEVVNKRKSKRRKNEYASITIKLRKRLRNGLGDWYYRLF